MKNLLLIAVFVGLSVSLQAQNKKEVIRLSDPVKVTNTYEVFGSDLGKIASPKSLSATIASSATNSEADVVVNASIEQVCQKKGCFFIAQDGDKTARITFKDYSFFIPTDSKGKNVTIVGKLTKKVLSEEQAKHYAEDAGKSSEEVVGEQVEYSIVATSIILQKETKK